MLRDAFGAPLDDCSECRSSESRQVDGEPRSVFALLCTHPAAVRANGGVAWLASCARDYACAGRWFTRRRRER